MNEYEGRIVTLILILALVTIAFAVGPGVVAAVQEDEPNDSRENAQSIPTGEEVTGTITGDDNDWFAFTAERGETINVTGSVAAGDPRSRIRLYTRGGGLPADATEFGETPESVGTTARYNGTYYVKIATEDGNRADYSFTVETYETDTFEPNEKRANATRIDGNTTQSGVISIGDTDWFAFTAERGETINVTGSVAAGDPSSRIRLHTRGGGLSADGTEFGETPKSVGITARYSGTYYVQMTAEEGNRPDYSFTVETYETDTFEPNEDRANATKIDVNTTQSGVSTIGDTDWFAFTVERGETINVTGSVAAGIKQMRLYRPDGNQIDRTELVETPESIGTTARFSGTYYVKVNYGRDSRAPSDYSFTVETYETDAFEPNEDRGNATRLYENPFPGDRAQASIADTDWFRFQADAGEDITVTSASTTADRIDIGLEDNDGNDIEGTRLFDSTKSFTATADYTGFYYLRVAPRDRGPAGAYNFTVDVPGETLGLANDRFERPNPPIGNQDRQNATSISPGQFTDLGMVDDDVDMYEISLGEGEKLSASIDFNHSKNDMELALRDSQGTIVAGQTDSNTDGESLEFTAPSAGNYYVEVSGEADAQAHYSMNVGIIQAVDVTIGPGGDTVEPGNTTTYAISVTNVGAGLSTANLSVSSSNTSVATLQDISPVGAATVEDKSVAPGSVSLNISGLDAGATGTVKIAEVTVSTVENGTATLAGDASLSAAGGASYPANSVQGTTIDVQVATPTPTLPGFSNPASDTDGDGLYEDVNGDGEFSIQDVQIFFQNRDSDVVQNNAQFFNFDETDPPEVSIGDVQALFQLFQE